MPDLPSGTVTFLFTDIEGSTRLWERYPEVMPAAYARHDAILRAAVAAHRGLVYKTIGDAFQIAFPSAPAAVAAAFAAQRAFTAEPWPGPEPLRMRMAVHVGDVDPDADGDYRSPVLNRLGRLLSAGHGGQVLLSHGVFELARDSLPEDVTLRDLGERHLKDLYRPEHIHQLLHPALPSDFPPLATLDRRRHNLPIQPTPLVGREAEVAEIQGLLVRRDARLVTLTGPGGIGKTRLGLQVAAELVDVFNHGAFFAALAASNDVGLVASAIAQALGVAEEPGRSILESVQDYLRERELLLVLDNFEHLLDAAPIVAGLLATAPGLKVLVTSRVRLGLRGEREVSVPPLSLPATGANPPLEQLTQYDAVRLFIARAQEARVGFQVTNETAPAVAEICARLDGLPLAIELAAARSKLLSPHALLNRLGQRLELLTGGARDLPDRHRTLRDTIAWSYDLLTPDEQALYRRLGVFVGGFSFESGEAVVDSDRFLPTTAFDGIASLVDKSLLRQEADVADEPRFTMLETIREYALERLEASGEADDARRRHAAAFQALVEHAASELQGPAQETWLDRLETEHNNLRAALSWAIHESGDVECGARLAGDLWRFWFIRGHFAEGRTWLERAMEMGRDLSVEDRDRMVTGAGSIALEQGDLIWASEFYEQSLALNRELADTYGVAVALANLGLTKRHLGDRAKARELLEESVQTLREVGDEQIVATGLLNLGTVVYSDNDLARAEMILEEALSLYGKAGDRRGVALSHLNLGTLAHDLGDDDRALSLLTEGLKGFWELGDKRGIVSTLESIARAAPLAVTAARLQGAADALQESINLATPEADREHHDRAVARVRSALGEDAYNVAWSAGRTLSWEDAVAEGLALGQRLEQPSNPADRSP